MGGLDFGVNAMTRPSAPGSSSGAGAVSPDKTPASPPVMAPPGLSPLALLAFVLAAGWLLFR